jgi:hypothetical protein
MSDLGPRELLGKTVMDDKGETIGYIKGVHQLTFPGGFEEVTIQNHKGIIFARIDELSAGEECFVLANGFHHCE